MGQGCPLPRFVQPTVLCLVICHDRQRVRSPHIISFFGIERLFAKQVTTQRLVINERQLAALRLQLEWTLRRPHRSVITNSDIRRVKNTANPVAQRVGIENRLLNSQTRGDFFAFISLSFLEAIRRYRFRK